MVGLYGLSIAIAWFFGKRAAPDGEPTAQDPT
jgi:Sec-independent protein secretion pathway component TatC